MIRINAIFAKTCLVNETRRKESATDLDQMASANQALFVSTHEECSTSTVSLDFLNKRLRENIMKIRPRWIQLYEHSFAFVANVA